MNQVPIIKNFDSNEVENDKMLALVFAKILEVLQTQGASQWEKAMQHGKQL